MATLKLSPFFFSMKRKHKHNYEECAAAALNYRIKQEFRENSSREFQWLRRNNLLEQACAHMEQPRRKITNDEIDKVAKQFGNRRAFRDADQSLYQAARKRGILDDVCSHMVTKKRKMSDEQIAEIAAKYTSRTEFIRNDNGAYQTAKKRGFLDAVCDHMDYRETRRLSNAEIYEIAKRYETRNDFGWGDFGAYITATRRGILDDVCANMQPNACGFRPDKPGVVYQFRMVLPDGQTVYKVGITNRKPSVRLTMMGLLPGVKATLTHCIKFAHGRDARMTEKLLHRLNAAHRYDGPPVMKNGNTELFTVQIINSKEDVCPA